MNTGLGTSGPRYSTHGVLVNFSTPITLDDYLVHQMDIDPLVP